MPIVSYRLLAAITLFVAALSLRAAEKVDIYGDRLPPGAVARLGSLRLRHAAEAIAFAPDGKTFATGGSDNRIYLWSAVDGREIRAFYGHTEPIQVVAFSADGKKLYSSSQDATLREWNTASGEEIRSVNVGKMRFRDIVAHPTEPRLVTSDLTSVQVWDLKSGTEVRRITLPGGVAIGLGPDGKTFAVFKDNAVSLRDLDNKEIRTLPITASSVRVLKLVFSADGSTLGGTGSDQSTLFWDVKSGRQINRFPGSAVDVGLLTLSSGGHEFAAKSSLGQVRVITVAEGEDVRQFEIPRITGGLLALAPDAKRLVRCQGKSILLWDVESGSPVGGSLASHSGAISAVRFSPDGKLLTSVSEGEVMWWNPTTSKPVATWFGKPLPFPGLTPDGRTVFTAIALGLARVDLVNGQAVEKRLITSPNHPFKCLGASSDLKVVAMRGVEQLIYFRSTENGGSHSVQPVRDPSSPACYTFSPDSKLFASVDRAYINFWEVPSPGVLRRIDISKEVNDFRHDATNRAGSPAGIVYSADGRSMLTVSSVDLVLWEVLPGHVRWYFPTTPNTATCATLSLDGRLVAVANVNGSIQILDAWTGAQLAERTGHFGAVRSLDFSPDNTRLASGSDDGTVLLWDIKDLNRSIRKAPQNLTEEQLALLWRDLADRDSAKAYKAMQALAASPQGVPYVVARVGEEIGRIQKLLVLLNDDDFEVRAKAQKDIEGLGNAVFPLLRLVLRNQPPPEVKVRIELILASSKDKEVPSGMLRTQRSMETLELAGSADALKALKDMAGNVNDPLARDAREILERLKRRGVVDPKNWTVE